MPRITKKMIQEEEERERLTIINTNKCIGLVMQKMELDVDRFGYIVRNNEEDNEITELNFDGKKCKSTLLNLPIDLELELPFDPYNNSKLALSLANFYINEFMGMEALMLGITNKKLNELGYSICKLTSGRVIEGNEYYRDSLKYIDMIYMLDGSAPPEFRALKEIDMENVAYRTK